MLKEFNVEVSELKAVTLDLSVLVLLDFEVVPACTKLDNVIVEWVRLSMREEFLFWYGRPLAVSVPFECLEER